MPNMKNSFQTYDYRKTKNLAPTKRPKTKTIVGSKIKIKEFLSSRRVKGETNSKSYR